MINKSSNEIALSQQITELEKEIIETRRLHGIQTDNYIKLYNAIMGNGCSTGMQDPYEIAEQHRKDSKELIKAKSICAGQKQIMQMCYTECTIHGSPYIPHTSRQIIEDALDKAINSTTIGDELIKELEHHKEAAYSAFQFSEEINNFLVSKDLLLTPHTTGGGKEAALNVIESIKAILVLAEKYKVLLSNLTEYGSI